MTFPACRAARRTAPLANTLVPPPQANEPPVLPTPPGDPSPHRKNRPYTSRTPCSIQYGQVHHSKPVSLNRLLSVLRLYRRRRCLGHPLLLGDLLSQEILQAVYQRR